jgi:putative ABC transport system ATP-binding protein
VSFIKLQNVTKHYLNDADCVAALQDVTNSIDEGCFLGIMGPSGSGKSTLLSVLGGLTHPTSGQVIIDNIDIYQLTAEKLADFRREYLGFIFQSHNLIPYLSARENVLLPLAVANISAAEKLHLAEAILERVGLADRRLHLSHQLSGGEQERVAIARALVNQPPLLMADEPTGSLDSETSQQIMTLLSDLNRDGQTIVMVTHNSDNQKWFDQTIMLKDGQLIEKSVRADRYSKAM